MDPVGPWYASYNRLAAGTAAGTFQAGGTTASGEFVSHHLSATAVSQSVSSTTASQLLLQAAHTTASLAGQPSPFNPGSFLSPTPVSYDVFTPLFHHPNAKQSHYISPHRQVMPQSQLATAVKQTTSDPEVSTIRENYNATHQTPFFEHQTQTTSSTTSTLTWNHQNSSQLPSPFGILPHESVVSSSPGPPVTKSSGSGSYENNFNSHFAPGQSLDNLNSPLPSSSVTTDFKSGTYSDGSKKGSKTTSPTNIKSTVSTSPDNGNSFFQQTPATFSPESLATNYSDANENSVAKVQSLHQQSCIVSTANHITKDYRIQTHSTTASTIFPNASSRSGVLSQDKNLVKNFESPGKTQPIPQTIQTKAQAKVYPELGSHEHSRTETSHEANQSSPISYSMMDARSLNYATSASSNCSNNANSKITNNPRTPSNTTLHHQQYHVLNQQTQQTASYRHYSGSQNEEYHHSGRSKSVTSTDSAYSSNTSTQNGPDCGVVVPRRPSPLQAHSQASPLSHVPSPAYPMYNSPMAAMSSPSPLQQHGDNNGNNQCANAQTYKTVVQQQVTPPSPLDVSVPRPASQGHVAYSSVITRALGAGENNKTNYTTENRTYDCQDFSQRQKQQQICWDNDSRQQNVNRKFSISGYTPTNAEMSPQTLQNHQPTSRMHNVPDRQQGYFDSNQMNLQNLNSCREDSMGIVKNIHQSSACQIQQQSTTGVSSPAESQKDPEERRKIDGDKKRRSFDLSSGSPVMTDYLNRIPPPAHHNSNQQQNGYFDFERWNLAPSASKMFSGSSSTYGTQNTLHPAGNFTGNTVHQHQSLMVSHPHAAPPIPYFPTFHLQPGHHPGHHPHEFQSSIDMPMGYGDNSSGQHSTGYQEFREEQPKVIVPNIEEELGFLQQNQLPVETANQVNKDLKPACKDPNSGFMTSYLKFLQGEREPSPPPAIRGGRKATWNRSKPYMPPEPIKPNEASTNGGNFKGQNSAKETPIIDYANDPRYFPLPKERKKPYIDSSDDGLSEDDFPFSLKKSERKPPSNNNFISSAENIIVKPEPKKKGRPIKPGGPTDRKRKAAAAAAAAAAADAAAGIPPKKNDTNLLLLPPRRETSKRKAKEKISTKQLAENSDDDEQGDSDSDPAWTPAAKLTGDDEEKKKKRGRPVISKKTRKMLDDDDYLSSDLIPRKGRKKGDMKNMVSKFACKIDEKLLASVSDEDIDISPFKRYIEDIDNGSGEFVVIKTELEEEYPALWRIDGKTLLQKYEPFSSNGKMLYRNISTYSGWTPQNRHLYQQVPVKFWQQGKLETIVEFLRDEMIIDDKECIHRSIKDNEKYQDNFEVYVQTLISQALDSNFLTEIFQEQDEYFLSNVKMIDEITEDRKNRLLSTTKWQPNVVTAISTWPCLNVLKDLSNAECKGKQCVGCDYNQIYARVLLYGQPYNATTLEGSPPDPSVQHEKDFLLCRVCQTKVALFNKVTHQKYITFLECARRVADKRLQDPKKDTTIILNELLADEAWLNQLFKEVRTIWAEIDSIEYQSKSKLNSNSTVNESNLQLPETSTQQMEITCLPIEPNENLSASILS